MEWWTPQQAGIVGAVLGGGVGGILIGAIGGGVCGPLAAMGKARAFVQIYWLLCAVLGLAILSTGLTAAALGQPFHVWFWLLNCGLLVLVLSIVLGTVFRRVYAQHERRRLAAEEFRRA